MAEWATVVITGKDKVECYDSEDERTLALVENYSGDDDVRVTLDPDSGVL